MISASLRILVKTTQPIPKHGTKTKQPNHFSHQISTQTKKTNITQTTQKHDKDINTR